MNQKHARTRQKPNRRRDAAVRTTAAPGLPGAVVLACARARMRAT